MELHAERDEHDFACPRCGAEADWSYIDEEKASVEIMCPNCGRYEMRREDFDQVVAESAEITEPE
jgi:predicted RNA-binding Zn-ribbon protein involved in translation (DUF1610 family)